MKPILSYLFAALLFTASPCFAFDPDDSQQWVKDERSLDGDATIYLSKQFSSKSGTFKATPESMTEKKDKISGSFVVGTYRYAYDKTVTDNGPKHDELVVTELMECNESYFGTLSRVKKLKGKIVATQNFADNNVSMVQTRGATIDSKLCAVHAGGIKPGIDPKKNANPSYRGNRPLTGKEADKLIDKYPIEK